MNSTIQNKYQCMIDFVMTLRSLIAALLIQTVYMYVLLFV